jgi:hypothetical protein
MDCSAWEKDPQSFVNVIAKHHIRTELGRPLSPIGGPSQVTKTAWRVRFPINNIVYVTLARVPDFVVAARWYPKPAGQSRFYTYSCMSDGNVVFTERQKP